MRKTLLALLASVSFTAAAHADGLKPYVDNCSGTKGYPVVCVYNDGTNPITYFTCPSGVIFTHEHKQLIPGGPILPGHMSVVPFTSGKCDSTLQAHVNDGSRDGIDVPFPNTNIDQATDLHIAW